MMAARLTDMTAHGGLVTGPGAATVLIGKLPAACMGDMHTCPMCNGPVPHVGGPIVMGCFTVFICKKPAARQTDMAICVGPPSSILMGCPTVLIGSGGGGGGGGGGGSASDASSASPDSAEAPASIEGLEAVPIELQRQLAEVQQYMEPEAYELMLQVVNDQFRQIEAGTASEDEETTQLTIADFVDILKKIELDEGYEAALHFAGHLDYTELCNITKAFINGDDTNADNDPNLMPTKYMILYGADDSRLTDIADHPDCTDEQEHKINVANLRKALILQGAEIPETGPYDDDVYIAFLQYLAKCTQQLKMNELNYDTENTPLAEDEKINEIFFENNAGEKVEIVKPNQTVNLVIKTSNMTGRKIDIDLNDAELDFEYNGRLLENDCLKSVEVSADEMKIVLKTRKG